MHLNHVGCITEDFEKSLRFIKKTFSVEEISPIIKDPALGATLCLVQLKKGPPIELVSGEGMASLIQKGPSAYHLCYEVPHLEESLKHFQEEGGLLVKKPMPSLLFDQRRVAFVYTPFGLIELLESR